MPYINSTDRILFEDLVDQLANILIVSSIENRSGRLNYILSASINKYLKEAGTSYFKCNDIIGALESSKLEFYRRKVALYENKKIKLHGDVYED